MSVWTDMQHTEELPRLQARRPSRLRRAISSLRLLLVCLAIFLAARAVVPTVAIEGESMSPTLHTGGRVLLSGVYRFGTPHRGDIVVFRPPLGADTPYIKRIIALPGETIAIHDGAVYIDGQLLHEEYLPGVSTSCDAHCALTVPDDAVFVMGDNRLNSSDSRDFGPIEIDSILGEALLSIWPPGAIE